LRTGVGLRATTLLLHTGSGLLISPRVDSALSQTVGGALPLVLRGETLAQPVAVVAGFAPVDSTDRQICELDGICRERIQGRRTAFRNRRLHSPFQGHRREAVVTALWGETAARIDAGFIGPNRDLLSIQGIGIAQLNQLGCWAALVPSKWEAAHHPLIVFTAWGLILGTEPNLKLLASLIKAEHTGIISQTAVDETISIVIQTVVADLHIGYAAPTLAACLRRTGQSLTLRSLWTIKTGPVLS